MLLEQRWQYDQQTMHDRYRASVELVAHKDVNSHSRLKFQVKGRTKIEFMY